MSLEDLGYNNFFAKSIKELGLEQFSVARVISEFKNEYKIKNDKGEYRAKVTGKQIFTASSKEDYPAVGDWVVVTIQDNEQATIQKVLPRISILKRSHGDKSKINGKNEVQVIATNIDTAFVIESIDRDFSLNRFERYFAIAESGGVKPAIILNKIDLISKEELDKKLALLKKRFPKIDIILTSTINNHGLDDLKKYIVAKKTYCFLGSSGVGKSTLINRLLGEDSIKTGAISSYSGRGKHTTTTRQMYFLDNGGIVIDNPGIREVGIASTYKGIENLFDEITVVAERCKYTDCSHTHEPGCKVIEAVANNELDEEKYSNYLNLKKEAEYTNMSKFDKREKDRQFGKFIKKAKKDLRDFDM